MASRRYFLALAFIGALTGCASSGPATSFYSFFPSDSLNPVSESNASFTLGVGPIKLPEYLENPAVVSLTDGQRLRVSGYHAWAGGIKDAISRVVADDLSSAFPNARITAFPWDNRMRPDYQLRLHFTQFAGVRGDEVNLKLVWMLVNQQGDDVIATGKVARDVQSESVGVEAYVQALNRLLNESVFEIAEEIAPHLTL